MKKICFFDVDSTVVTIEGCDRLAAQKGYGTDVAAITNAAMNGTVDFDTSFVEKHMLIAPSRQEIDTVGQLYCRSLTPGSIPLLEYLFSHDRHVGLLTHGYHEAALHLGKYLGISASYIFGLHTEHTRDGQFLGLSDHPLRYKKGKSEILRSVRHQESNAYIVFIGDSMTDLESEPETDLFIGCGLVLERPLVKHHARYFCTNRDEIKMLLAASQEHRYYLSNSQ